MFPYDSFGNRRGEKENEERGGVKLPLEKLRRKIKRGIFRIPLILPNDVKASRTSRKVGLCLFAVNQSIRGGEKKGVLRTISFQYIFFFFPE